MSMAFRKSQRTSTILASVGIVVLVMVLVYLWTGVQHGLFSSTQPQQGQRRVETNLTSVSMTTSSNWITPSIAPTVNPTSQPRRSSKLTTVISADNSGEIEYVKPIKLKVLLDEHDILYEHWQAEKTGSKFSMNDPSPLKHHSGHFRHRNAEIWDPHPQYVFEAFGRHLHLILEQNTELVVPNIKITHVWSNTSVQRASGPGRPEKCLYTGRVSGDDDSSVTVSLCNGMTGHIRTSTGSYFIEPVEHFPNVHSVQSIRHAVRRLSGDSFSGSKPSCGLDEDDNDTDDFNSKYREVNDDLSSVNSQKRKKRSTNKYFIELLVVLDYKMKAYHKYDVDTYVITLLSIVDRVYKDASIGNSINIAVIRLVHLEDDSMFHDRTGSGLSASQMLRQFCAYQQKELTDPNVHHDAALLLTRRDICRLPGQKKCDTLGLAELKTMCSPSYSCAIVQDNGLSAAFTIAHELGHVLNMPHDDDPKCDIHRHSGQMTRNHIMSRTLDQNTYPWSWSTCSRHSITEFLDAGLGACLHNRPGINAMPQTGPDDVLPGEKYIGDRQCELVFGRGSKLCSFMPNCTRLWCNADPGEVDGCRTMQMPWADGTSCAQGSWCLKGMCVPANRNALLPTDGDWGPWQGWGPCSRTCGGGVSSSIRECDNPAPTNGGHYCSGQRVKYRSCNKENCPDGSQDFREEQCAVFDNNNRRIQGLHKDVKWGPKFGVPRAEQCKLYCRILKSSSYFLLEEKVVDGTQCSPYSFHKCVNGLCRKAGCDNELDSDMDIDECGVCGGDNSTCQMISGSYNRSSHGYNTVKRIPKGASNIMILQRGYQNSYNDDNFLALRDGLSGEYILNGHEMVTRTRKLIVFGGIMLEYSGSDSVIERLNSSRARRITRDLVLEILSVGRIYPPDLTFEYTLSAQTEYVWQQSNWTDCDKICQGQRYQKVNCFHRISKSKVSDEYCTSLKKIPTRQDLCNKECHLSWQESSRTECSSPCGDTGKIFINYNCQQTSIYGNSIKYVDSYACKDLDPPKTSESCIGACVYWEYGEWDPCSVTCGVGSRKKVALRCLDSWKRPTSDALCNRFDETLAETCDAGPCPNWSLGEWTPCSTTCGPGLKSRVLSCKINNTTVGGTECNSLMRPITETPCVMEPCQHELNTAKTTPIDESYIDNSIDPSHNIFYKDSRISIFKWRLGRWGPCSKSCDGGERMRQVICADDRSQTSENCSGMRPNHREICNNFSCPPKWNVGAWGECESTCQQQRQVVCQDPAGTRLPAKLCYNRKPLQSQYCCRYQWKTSKWTKCSNMCGKGTKSRQVYCVDTKLNSSTSVDYKIPDQYCKDLLDKPVNIHTCRSRKECVYDGKSTKWSRCSVPCSRAILKRKINCHKHTKKGWRCVHHHVWPTERRRLPRPFNHWFGIYPLVYEAPDTTGERTAEHSQKRLSSKDLKLFAKLMFILVYLLLMFKNK